MAKFAIAVSQFNAEITEGLLKGARVGLRSRGVSERWVKIYRVPGAFELPVTALKLARSKSFCAVICLGAVVRGETPHFEHVARAAADGLQRVAVETGVPVIFGVLTTNTMAQARARSRWPSSRRTRRDGKESYNNKGWEAAQAAFEMSALMKAI